MHNPSHEAKRGTPTMGGVIFIVGSIVGYFTGVLVSGEVPALSAILVIWLMVGFGAVGFIDDYMKVRSQRSLGLSGWRKVIGQLLVIIPFGIVALNFPNKWGQMPASPAISLFRDITWLNLFAFGVVLGWILYLVWISIIGVATSNSVNLTDGLDGLAAGAGVIVVGAYSVIAFWQFKQPCIGGDPDALGGCYEVRDPFNLAIIAAVGRRQPHRVPLVERAQGEGLHGRCRLDGDRRRDHRDGDPHPHRAPPAGDRRRVRPVLRLPSSCSGRTSRSRAASGCS